MSATLLQTTYLPYFIGVLPPLLKGGRDSALEVAIYLTSVSLVLSTVTLPYCVNSIGESTNIQS